MPAAGFHLLHPDSSLERMGDVGQTRRFSSSAWDCAEHGAWGLSGETGVLLGTRYHCMENLRVANEKFEKVHGNVNFL
jgi:hypothetical protein